MTVNELVDKLVDVEQSLDVGSSNPPILNEHALKQVQGTIPLLTRVKIQDVITDRYLEPTPRALTRHFNKQIRRTI